MWVGGRTQTDTELIRITNHRYIPIMITRLMISLRKAARSPGSTWSMGESTADRGPGRETYGMRFAPNRAVSNARDDSTLVQSPILPGV